MKRIVLGAALAAALCMGVAHAKMTLEWTVPSLWHVVDGYNDQGATLNNDANGDGKADLIVEEIPVLTVTRIRVYDGATQTFLWEYVIPPGFSSVRVFFYDVDKDNVRR